MNFKSPPYRNYVWHTMVRVIGFPFVFLICYGIMLWQYKEDPYGYGAMFALVSAILVAVVFLAIEAVLLLFKGNKKYLINITILLVLIFFYLFNYYL